MSDDYQSISVAEARAAVQASGELEGIEGPLFLADGENPEWEPFFSKTLYGQDGHPEFAQVIVTRKGQAPRRVVIAWDEYAEQMDADPEWDAIRASKPMTIFGSEVERHAYRVVFADVLAPLLAKQRREPEAATASEPPAADAPPSRDWLGEIRKASASVLNALYDEARDAGALVKVEGLQQAFTDRLLELSSTPKIAPLEAGVSERLAPKRPRNRGRGRR